MNDKLMTGGNDMVTDAYNLLVKYDGDLNKARPDELVKVLMQNSPDADKSIALAIRKYKARKVA